MCDKVKWGESDKWHFLNGPMFNLLIYCHIILYWEKETYYEKFGHNLTLEVHILYKISTF